MYCIAFVLALILVLVSIYMSVFESPPHHSMRMDQDQMYSIGSPDLREDALDDMLHRIHLQSDDQELLEQKAERDQLCQQADLFIHAMENPVGRRIGLNPVPEIHTCSSSTPVCQLHQPAPDEYNQFNLQNINAPTPPKWKNNEIFLRT